VRATAIAAISVAGLLACSIAPSAGVWAINESTNDYVIRESGDLAGGVVSAWSLPAGASGFTMAGAGLMVEVLDAGTCALVATQDLKRDMLLTIDPHGRAEFVAQPDPPAMNSLLSSTYQCDTSPQRSTSTS
jgi:hypothetical protein